MKTPKPLKPNMTKDEIRKRIEYECYVFCQTKGIPEREKDLQMLALQSYYAMRKKDRYLWSLEQIVLQRL